MSLLVCTLQRSSAFVPQNDAQSYTPPEVGGGTGKHQFTFTPTGEGTEIVRFQYRRVPCKFTPAGEATKWYFPR